MLTDSKAFSGFAVDDLQKAHEFYGETLGLKTEVLDETNGLLSLHHPGDRDTLVYQKPDFTPATYTVLNFPVPDIDEAVDRARREGRSVRAVRGLRPGRQRHRPRRRPEHRVVQGSRGQHPVGARTDVSAEAPSRGEALDQHDLARCPSSEPSWALG